MTGIWLRIPRNPWYRFRMSPDFLNTSFTARRRACSPRSSIPPAAIMCTLTSNRNSGRVIFHTLDWLRNVIFPPDWLSFGLQSEPTTFMWHSLNCEKIPKRHETSARRQVSQNLWDHFRTSWRLTHWTTFTVGSEVQTGRIEEPFTGSRITILMLIDTTDEEARFQARPPTSPTEKNEASDKSLLTTAQKASKGLKNLSYKQSALAHLQIVS